MSTPDREERPEERALIEACLTGKRLAQSALYERYSKAMYQICLRMMVVPEEAEDLLQEAFVDVFTHLQSYRYESTLGAWIKRIVVNRCINRLKSRKLQLVELTHHELPAIPYGEVDFEDQLLKVNRIKSAMKSLPDGYRTVLSLYLFEGYDHQEIGEILGISEETSKSQYCRARGRLKEMMKEY